MARSVKNTASDHYAGSVFGEYRLTNLDTIINNFILLYIGDEKVFRKIPRWEVAAVAQRAIQEFSYDTFKSEKNQELELNPVLTVKMPPDYINYVQISWVDQQGITRIAYRTTRSHASSAVLQDQDYEPITDANGDVIIADTSEQTRRFQDPSIRDEALQLANNYYNNYISDYNYSYYNETYYGRQWG